MSGTNKKHTFTAQHHALLFAGIAREVISLAGEKKGGNIMETAVEKYGRQRGKRMALRALKNGHGLTVADYFAYGEWEVPKGEMDLKFVKKNPDVCLNIFKCPWHSTWREHDLLEYGKYFCRKIDAALVHGFNPDLKIEINSTQTNGGDFCDFIFRDARLTLFKILGLAYKKKIRPGKDAVMPWEYHIGHLFKTTGEVIHQELGTHAQKIMETALAGFAHFSSKEHIEIIKTYVDIDFDKLPR